MTVLYLIFWLIQADIPYLICLTFQEDSHTEGVRPRSGDQPAQHRATVPAAKERSPRLAVT
ncbi:MAG: hypothetical protein PHS73_02215, partial [Candidatus Peribacteraceae bacterium]|nr:hypothetical protein [Candidatus Peribacteraceae bacterium]